jgi:hypothetical protein
MKDWRRKTLAGSVGFLLLAASGFAAAAIASGSSLAEMLTGTTGTGTTETGTGTTGTSTGAGQRKVTICHHTHSAKHPFVTITVGAPAVTAHMKHGDTIGPCAPALAASTRVHGKGAHTATKTKHAAKTLKTKTAETKHAAKTVKTKTVKTKHAAKTAKTKHAAKTAKTKHAAKTLKTKHAAKTLKTKHAKTPKTNHSGGASSSTSTQKGAKPQTGNGSGSGHGNAHGGNGGHGNSSSHGGGKH